MKSYTDSMIAQRAIISDEKYGSEAAQNHMIVANPDIELFYVMPSSGYDRPMRDESVNTRNEATRAFFLRSDSVEMLAKHFEITPDVVRRWLEPNAERPTDREEENVFRRFQQAIYDYIHTNEDAIREVSGPRCERGDLEEKNRVTFAKLVELAGLERWVNASYHHLSILKVLWGQ